jgi:hypothetical protein
MMQAFCLNPEQNELPESFTKAENCVTLTKIISMFRESADAYIAERIEKMTPGDKKQLLTFIEMQVAYKRAAKMNTTVKGKGMKMEDIVAIVRKVRKAGARAKN